MNIGIDQRQYSQASSAARLRRTGILLGIGYWSSLLVVLTIIALIDGWETIGTFGARCINTVLAIVMTFLIAQAETSFARGRFAQKVVFVLVLTLIVATAYFWICYYIFKLFGANESPLMLGEALRMILYWFAQFLGWSALFLALIYSDQVQESERQVAQLREQAFGAQMQALQYQINPHFLFNTLNAVATLIEERDVKTAERMVLLLSRFLRSTLTLDPVQDITLSDELEIQSRYLEIERERFSDRLTVSVEIPHELTKALVPSLILQPLVENAVKHGVHAVERSVRIRIGARAVGDTLRIHVENDAPVTATATSGAGVGLRNVAQRLVARFGDRGRLESGPAGPSAYCATVSLPLRFAVA